MKLTAKFLATGIFGMVMAATAAPAQTVTIDYDHTVNFLKFKTYTWAKLHATDPSVEDRITIAVNRDMGGRYMTESDHGDVLIAAVDATHDAQEFGTFYDSLGSDYSWQRPWGSGFMDSEAALTDIPVNTLVIDMYDGKTHKLLWRGTVTEPLQGSTDKKDNEIDKAVTELIGKYPPKYKK
jgi:hypothetical protein